MKVDHGPSAGSSGSARIVDNSYDGPPICSTLGRVRWDGLFEDLEGQLASEWEAERAALDAESERLRISRLDLRSRLRVLCQSEASVTLELAGMHRLLARLRALGVDWVAADTGRDLSVIPLDAIIALSVDHGDLLSSLQESATPGSSLRERMTMGFVMRDLARRRVPVRVALRGSAELHGTIDRAGSDHLDLALHDSGEARRANAISGFRIVPFSAMQWVRTPGGASRLP